MLILMRLIMWPFSLLLYLMYLITGSYGWSIVLFAVAIKLIMLYPSAKSKRNTMHMARMNPKMQEIKKRCGNDQERYAMEIQKLYQSEHVNPLGGCLWSFLPLPILIALYGIIRRPVLNFMLINMARPEALEKVEALNPDSLTVHSLALKRATRLNLFKDKYQEISFENSAEIMKMTMDSAHRMEMGPYYMYRQKNMAGNFENVGYSREGKAGIYNILIMEEKQSILAAGAGASTKFVFDHGERIERVENVKDLKNYVERIDEMIERKRIGMEKYLPK